MTIKEQNGIDTPELGRLRSKIDAIDNQLIQLLADRMKASSAIGEYKKQRQIQIIQSNRYKELLNRVCEQGIKAGLRKQFVTEIMEAIHNESVRQQEVLIDNKQ